MSGGDSIFPKAETEKKKGTEIRLLFYRSLSSLRKNKIMLLVIY